MQRCRAAGAACCLLALSVGGSTARAADGDPWLAGLASRLRADPVVVSDSVSRAVSPREVARLRAAVRAMPVPTRVAILSGPSSDLEVTGPSLFDLPQLLAGAIDRPGLYVAADADDDILGRVHLAAAAVHPRVAPEDVEGAALEDVVPETRTVARILYSLRVAATGARPLRGAAERALAAQSRDLADGGGLSTAAALAIGFGGGGGLLAFAIPTAVWWRRRPRRPRPERVQPLVREPAAQIAGEAGDAVARLAAAIAAAQQPVDAAFDLYAAASKADREARSPIDSVGALVLAQDGEDALAGRPRRRRCFFDPGHRGQTAPTRWRRGDEEAEVPACPRCTDALRSGRAPDTLGDRGRPYYERDTVWGRTGLGAIDDDLAAKVLAGR
ncbi:MAG: hypothetical protein QOE11_1952 [Solirubrobacteraceae bacterium]|jgi:hypothetical protein|nr:hypothetical protein [Solirubrobacteraceae bacterium]